MKATRASELRWNCIVENMGWEIDRIDDISAVRLDGEVLAQNGITRLLYRNGLARALV